MRHLGERRPENYLKCAVRFDALPYSYSIACDGTIAVGTAIAGRPRHRSVRADFPHTVLTADDDDPSGLQDRDGESSHWEASVAASRVNLTAKAYHKVVCIPHKANNALGEMLPPMVNPSDLAIYVRFDGLAR